MIEKTVSAEIEIREVEGVRRLEGTLIQEGARGPGEGRSIRA